MKFTILANLVNAASLPNGDRHLDTAARAKTSTATYPRCAGRIIVALATLLCSGPAAAASVDIISATGIWTAAAPAVFSLNGVGTSVIKWGVPHESDGDGVSQSGYEYIGYAPPVVLGIPVGVLFPIGDFVHHNFPILFGTNVTSATLKMTTDLVVAGQPVSLDSVFSVFHDETLNQLPCPYAGSLSICDDLVSLAFQTNESSAFTLDGVEYVVDILGFKVGGLAFTHLLTQENKSSMATLMGIVRSKTPVEVPNEWTVVLLLGGMAGVAWWRVPR